MALAFLAACTRSEAPKAAPSGEPPPKSGSVGAPFDVAAVIRQVRYAYQPEGNGWRGGYGSYDVEASATGLRLTPFHVQEGGEAVAGTPLKLGAARLSRGGRGLASGTATGRVEEDGHLSLARGGTVEHLRNGEDGVEQSWAFERAPAGQGDLVVRIPVEGLEYTGVTDGGLHFADATTGLGFRYGHATWVDASGRRTPLRAGYAQGHIQLSVPSALLASSSYPAVLDPVISPEFGMDTPVLRPPEGSQLDPSVAALGSTFLVVWSDTRAGTTADLYGARVDGQGRLMDPLGLRINTAPGTQDSPAVARLGDNWFVVWRDTRSSERVYGTRVSAEGVALDGQGKVLSPNVRTQFTPDVAVRGTTALVVWGDFGNSEADIYGTRVLADGTVVDSPPLLINGGYYYQETPSVAASADGWYVVWTDHGGESPAIRGTRVTPEGEVLEPWGQLLETRPGGFRVRNPVVSSDGSQWLVAWEHESGDPAYGYDILGLRVGADGQEVNNSTFVIASLPRTQLNPDVVFHNGSWYVVYLDAYYSTALNVMGARVSPTGAVSGPWRIGSSSVHQGPPSLASNGESLFVTWGNSSSSSGSTHVNGIRWNGTETPQGGILVASQYNSERAPAAAFNGTHWLVVWEDDLGRAADTNIHGVRVSPAGTVLDSAARMITSTSGRQGNPDVAALGSEWLVVWEDSRADSSLDVYCARVTGAGTVFPLPSALGSGVGTRQANPTVTSNWAHWFVVWEDGRNNATTGLDLYGIRVLSVGTTVEPSAVPLNRQPGHQREPAVTSNGTDYLLAWSDERGGVGSADIYATRISQNGALLDGTGVALSVAPGVQAAPAVASDGQGYFVVWEDSRDAATTGTDLRGTRVSRTGGVLDGAGVVVSQVLQDQRRPSVAFGETDYLVVWEDSRSGSGRDIYGTRVTQAGEVSSGPGGFVISNGAMDEYAPEVSAAPGAGQWLITYQHQDDATVSTRIRARLATFNEPPVAQAQSATLDEDTTASLTLSGTDPEGAQLSADIASQPAHGVLSGAPPEVTYTPAADYHGPDSFTFTVSDGRATSAPVTVSLTVLPVNDAPVATEQAATVDEDASQALTLSGTDAEGEALTFAIASPPLHGVLSGTAPEVTYTPDPDYHGPDSFTFTVMDTAGAVSASATVSLTVRPVNDAPVAQGQAVATDEDVPVALTTVATDIDGDALTYTVVSPPAHGSLTGVLPRITYTPAANFHGDDSFTFTVRDAAGAVSAPATVSLSVAPVNDVPVADAQGASVDEDSAVDLTLVGRDADGDALTYHVAAPPTHGTLTGSPPELRYTPTPDYHGADSFTFTVTDGMGAVSAQATVSLTVRARNDVPVAQASRVETDEDTAVALTLAAADTDGDRLTFVVVSPPAHGRLTGTPPDLTYTPSADYHGDDRFTFRVNDGTADSNVATVTLAVRSVNDAPVAQARTVSTDEETAAAVTLTGTDVEGDPLTFTVLSPPAHGTLSGTPPDLTYTPNADFHGTDRFTFQAHDGTVASAPATVSLTVRPVNDVPVAHAQSLTTREDTAAPVTLTGSDVDGDALVFTITTPPAHGTLTGAASILTYTPAANFHGSDSFSFTVRDGSGAVSAPATVSLTIDPVNDVPVAASQALSLDEDAPVALTLRGTDIEDGSVVLAVATQPAHGTLTGTPPDLTYTPDADFHGVDRFTFTATDSQGATSAPANVFLTVRSVNDAPAAQAQDAELDEDHALALVLGGTDVDGDRLTFAVTSPPTHGVLTGTPPSVEYRPDAHYHGTDSFTFEVRDGQTRATATVSLTVRPVNDAPVASAQSLRIALEPTALTLSATDVEGEALTYAIAEQPAQGTLSGTPPNLTYTPAEGFRGTVTFTFTASDGQATSQPAAVTLVVGNSIPVVAFTPNTLHPDEGEEVRFQATAADANGDALRFHWDFGDGTTSEEQSPSHAYANEGTYEVALTVTDGIDTVSEGAVLEVRNAAPVVVPLEAPAQAEEGRALVFRAQASDSGSRDTFTFSWDFGDGSAPVAGAEASHTYADSGRYTVKVTVTDDAGAFTQTAREVEVSNVPPVPEAVADQAVTGGTEVTVQLRATDAAGERDPLSWKLVEGPGSVTSEGLYRWKPEDSEAGRFPVRAQVVDDEGAASDVVFAVTVTAVQKPPPPVPPEDSGCGCSSGTRGAPVSFLLLALAVLVTRRRPARG